MLQSPVMGSRSARRRLILASYSDNVREAAICSSSDAFWSSLVAEAANTASNEAISATISARTVSSSD